VWVVIRVICAAITHEAESLCKFDDEVSGSQVIRLYGVQSLYQLRKLLVSLQQKNSDMFESEALFVISKLTEVIRMLCKIGPQKSGFDGNDTVIVDSIFDILNYLISSNATVIISRLADRKYISQGAKEYICSSSTSKFMNGEDFGVDDTEIMMEGISTLSNDNSIDIVEASTEWIGMINSILPIALNIQIDSELKLTSSLWLEFTTSQIAKLEPMQSILDARFQEVEDQANIIVSANTPSNGIANGMSKLKSLNSFSVEYESQAKYNRSMIIDAQLNRLREWVKYLESLYRKYDMRWTRIYAESANERGPWGIGGGENSEVFWMLDNYENNLHMKLRLRRNLMGTKHLIASQRSAGKFSKSPSTSQKHQSKVFNQDEEVSGSLAINFKGLKKYKNESVPNSPMKGDGASEADQTSFMLDIDDDDDLDDSSHAELQSPVSTILTLYFLLNNKYCL